MTTAKPCPACGWAKLTPFWAGWLKYFGCVLCLTYFFTIPKNEK